VYCSSKELSRKIVSYFNDVRKYLQIREKVKIVVKVISIICIAHPYCALFMASFARARAHWNHGGFDLIVSPVRWNMALAHQRARVLHLLFSILCNQLIKSFVWEKTDPISIAENWINEKISRYTVVFSILAVWPPCQEFGSNFQSTIA